MKAEHRAALEAVLREDDEDRRRMSQENARLLSEIVERDVQIAKLTTDLNTARMQLSAYLKDRGDVSVSDEVVFEADFEIDIEDTDEL